MRTTVVRTIAGRVNADGTPATGAGFTSRKTGTGAYALTFPGQRLQSLAVTGAADAIAVRVLVQTAVDRTSAGNASGERGVRCSTRSTHSIKSTWR
jgi:hypothetical protein